MVQHVLTAAVPVGKRDSDSAVGAHLKITLSDAARQQHGRSRPFSDVQASHSTRAGSGGLCGRRPIRTATARPFVTLQQARRKVVA
eukprot:4088185-Prymnesium_polylepis.1